MTAATSRARSTIKIGKRLQNKPKLATKARAVEGLLRQMFDANTQIEWDLFPDKPQSSLAIRIVRPRGECTRYVRSFLLDNHPVLEEILQEAKESLDRLETWLVEVDRLFQDIRSWITRHLPAYRIEEVPLTIEEAFTRDYAKKLDLITPDKRIVEVRPIAAWSPGSEGRVDLFGPEYEQTLIFSSGEGGWLWVDESGGVNLRPLTGELFIRLVKDCLE